MTNPRSAAHGGLPRRLDRVTLPADERPDALDPAGRALVAQVWRERAASELAASLAFAAIASRVIARGNAPDVQYLAARAVADEVRHAHLCLALAERYGAKPVWPRVMPPDGGDPTDLLILGTCCVNESLGSAFLEATLAACETDVGRHVVRRLLADEVDHARIGWAHLAAMTEPEQARVERSLPALLEVCLRPWEQRLETLPREGQPAHGVLAPARIREVVDAALAELVLPGFAHLGLDVGPARDWLAAHRA